MFIPILLFVATLAAAQQPKPCETPPQWEGRFVRTDYEKKFFQAAKISYDENEKRVREIEEIEIDNDRDYYDVLYLHNMNKEYRLNLRTRKCNTTTLSRPWFPFGVPPEAEYDGEAVIGPVNIDNEHVTIVRFHGRVAEGDFFGTVSFPDCIPINSGFFSNRTGFVETTFFDITTGIPDPTVFNPPSECTP
ncbi:hypothetical protein BaRGS_00026545 [Batillaria attramentaria]|uniref:Mammalian ependymin-related protein 1 n=1 Tax=Batillaria attramentaria TaxID=370345 RepID=A0ABD0K4E2_9CAEN